MVKILLIIARIDPINHFSYSMNQSFSLLLI